MIGAGLAEAGLQLRQDTGDAASVAAAQTSSHLQNRLLASLADEDFRALEPHLERMRLERGRPLCGPTDKPEHAWFPHDSVISLVASMREGGSAEMATIGREGVFPVSVALSGGPTFGRAGVQVGGWASRIGFDRLRTAALASETLRLQLGLYAEALLGQSLQLVACNALHPVEARCCRWLLMTQDRVRGPHVPLTQEYLSEMLGVQRSTVTVVSRGLQDQGLLSARRGVVAIADRAGVEARACECYGLIRETYERLLPETYRSD